MVSSISQLLLKMSASRKYPNALREYINPMVLGAYFLLFCSMLVMIIAYRILPLSLGPIIEALGYVFVAILGIMVLRERIAARQCLGILLIIVGVVVCSVA